MRVSHLETLVRTGQYAQAMRTFLELLKDESLTRQELAHAYHYASVCRYSQEEYFSAVELAKLAEEHAVAAGDGELLGRIWVNQIEFYRWIGDVHLALEYGEKWTSHLALYPNLKRFEPVVHFNKALIHRTRKELVQSLERFRAAVDALERDQRTDRFRVQVHQMYAWTLYETYQIDAGDEQIETADRFIEDSDHEAVREQLLLKCLRAYQVEDYENVCLLAEEFLAPGMKATLIQSFWATWMLGMTTVKFLKFKEAHAIALLARDYALKSERSDLMNRATELLRLANREGSAG